MANIEALKTELTDDPLSRGYSGMDDVAAADDLNTVYRERNITSMTSTEVLNLADATEYAALDAADNLKFWQLLGLGTLNPWGSEATLMIGIFGAGSATIVNLAAARKENISRARELSIGFVYPGHVQNARM